MRYVMLVFLGLAVCASIACTQHSQSVVDRTAAQKQIVSNEKAVMEAVLRNDTKAFHSYLVSDGLNLTDAGPLKGSDVDKLVEQQKAECNLSDGELTASTFYWLNDSAVVHMYKATIRGSCQNQTIPPSWLSTVWTNQGGKWLGAFHQETNVAAPAAASPTK